ncbi:MAG: PAS domain S-box protein [Bacteroidetes bacterium]|nr:MAG: PAS domain S-box protein [Bacteroidota bacterium]
MAFRIRKIRTKLQLYFMGLIGVFLATLTVLYFYSLRYQAYYTLRNEANALQVALPKMVKAEQDFILLESKSLQFLLEGETPNLNRYNQYSLAIRQLTQSLEEQPIINKLGMRASLHEAQTLLQKHHEVFTDLVGKLRLRGFKGYGLEGKMRDAVYRMQTLKSLPPLAILTLRKYEKDFLLRKDDTYRDTLHVEAQKFIAQAQEKIRQDAIASRMAVDTAEQAQIKNLVEEYVRQFDKIADIEKTIGLQGGQQGLYGDIGNTTTLIEKKLAKITEEIHLKTKSLTNSSTQLLYIFTITIIVLAIAFALIISYRMATPIVVLDRIARSVTKGLRNQEQLLDTIRNQDEIGSLAKSFKEMLVRLKSTIAQAHERNRKLEEFAESETKRRWLTEGLSIFNEILRNNQIDLDRQAFEIVSEVVKYTKSAQGGLFIVNHENTQDKFLELKACYAYQRRKYQQKRINHREGLVGMAWATEQTMLVQDIPEDYAYISSALGEAPPKCLLIVPMRSDEGIEGVLEIMSFVNYQDFEIEFIEILSQRIGNALVALKSNQKTKELLAISEKIAQEAQEKEAELRKRLEESQVWIHQFEQKLNKTSEEAQIYNAILGRVYAGMFITDDHFRIQLVNLYVAKRLGYKRGELENRPVELFLETENQLWRDEQTNRMVLQLPFFHQTVEGKVTDRRGNEYAIEVTAGKIEAEGRTLYVFLFNETEANANLQPTAKTANLKIAS